MFCKNCNSPLGPDDKFCNVCGQVVDPNPQVPQGGMNPNPQMGNQMPQGEMNPNPQMGNQMPQGGMNPNPQMGYNQMPQGGMNPNPQMGYNQMPQGGMNQAPQMGNQPEKKNNTVFIIIVVVLVLAIVGVVLYLTLGKSSSNNGGGSGTNNGGNNTTNNNNNNGGNNVSSNNTISISGYQFSAPSGYIIQDWEETKIFVNRSSQVAIMPSVMVYDFTTLKAGVNELKAELTAEGASVTGNEVKTVNGIEFLLIYGKYSDGEDSFEFLYAFNSLSEHESAGFMVQSYVSPVKNFVNDVASVAKSAKTGSSYSFNPSGDTNDFEVVKTELARIKDNKLNKEELFK